MCRTRDPGALWELFVYISLDMSVIGIYSGVILNGVFPGSYEDVRMRIRDGIRSEERTTTKNPRPVHPPVSSSYVQARPLHPPQTPTPHQSW